MSRVVEGRRGSPGVVEVVEVVVWRRVVVRGGLSLGFLRKERKEGKKEQWGKEGGIYRATSIRAKKFSPPAKVCSCWGYAVYIYGV